MSSAVNQLSSYVVPTDIVVALCRKFGKMLNLSGMKDDKGALVDAARLLWAFTGNETAFGKLCRPRFEPAYYIGGYYYQRSASVRGAITHWGSEGACSYGLCQVLFINAYPYMPGDLQNDPATGMSAAVAFMNRMILAQKIPTITDLFDAWNTGNWKDSIRPAAYIDKALHTYHEIPIT